LTGEAPTSPGWRLQVHEAIGSTSDHCAALAAAGEPGGLAVLALRQIKGRGSRGRGWQSPIGNLSLSVLLRPSGTLSDAGSWPLLTGIAVADAVRPLLPDPAALVLKWPNDVLLRGRKLAGILIDTALDQAGGLRWLIIGIGANLAVAPEVPGRVTACLPDVGVVPPPPEAFARDLLDRLTHWQSVLLRDGFDAIREAWLARAHPIGTALTVAFADQRVEGSFEGLSPEGHLVLRTSSGVRSFSTGEVLFSPS
jgi:BirA family transcriptional regulator, biotin operon repressor / biotin---[acetyl-CoA-carboxylase] ligase